ncbi:MAG TPA: hypothetical protein DCY86_17215 [Bdellovibrionales bacterium]|nr:hypothetical protein [Bdellovibrionales bacterium]
MPAKNISLKKQFKGTVEEGVTAVTEALKPEGFGILTRIDMHAKIKEKLGKEIPQTVILGACNPEVAYQAFLVNTDVAGLLPCNAVVRDLGNNRISVELTKASSMLEVLGDKALNAAALEVDKKLAHALENLKL